METADGGWCDYYNRWKQQMEGGVTITTDGSKTADGGWCDYQNRWKQQMEGGVTIRTDGNSRWRVV